MALDSALLSLLACPSDDHAPLREDGDRLVCTHCASSFPIEDGIPVLLMDDATEGPNGFGNAADGSPDTAPDDTTAG